MTKNRIFMTVLALLLSIVSWAQIIEVTGVVKDENGESMPGVGVMDKTDAKNGAITDLDGKYVCTYPSLREAAKSIKLTYQCIAACCKGLRPTAGGYKWRYKT